MECGAMGSMPSIPVYHNPAGKARSAQWGVLVKLAKYCGAGREGSEKFWSNPERFFSPSTCKKRGSGPCERERAAQSGNDGAFGCQRNYFLSVWQGASNYLIPAPLYFWSKGSASLHLHVLRWERSLLEACWAVSHLSLALFEKAVS